MKMKFSIKPLLDNVIIREIPWKDFQLEMTGIATPENRRGSADRGEVVAVGDGIAMAGVLLPMPVKVGDIVQFGEYGLDQVWEKPEDRYKPDLPKYYKVRVADLHGIIHA